MAHQLDFIQAEHVLAAFSVFDRNPVPKDHEWSEYWVVYKGRRYQFKYAVELASTFTSTPILSTDFTSNESSRNYIANLGFPIVFHSPSGPTEANAYWIGATFFGPPEAQDDKMKDFITGKYWATDHDLSQGEGFQIYKLLQQAKVNDRIALRYFDKKGSRVRIEALGTVRDASKINQGKLDVVWDYNPVQYNGPIPTGTGAGNWWKTLFQIKRPGDIAKIFGTGVNEKRIARVTWNDNGWVMPSGPLGKSADTGSHEAKYGYGHEEWLLDTGKIIDGYHYAFLEPVRKHQDAYAGRKYDVILYSINGETKKRYWIGEIRNVEVLDQQIAENIKAFYSKKGWLNEMEEQIRLSGANVRGFSNWQGIDLFNIRFRIEDMAIEADYLELREDHPLYRQNRYSFGHFEEEFTLIPEQENTSFQFSAPNKEQGAQEDEETKKTIYHRSPRPIEIKLLHATISKRLTNLLRKKYGFDNVRPENQTRPGAGSRIDIVVREGGEFTFFEIKTYNSVRISIREAFGQLLEYAYWPKRNEAAALIIVTQKPGNPTDLSDALMYVSHLRESFKIPIYYQYFDLDFGELSERN